MCERHKGGKNRRENDSEREIIREKRERERERERERREWVQWISIENRETMK